MKLFKKISVLFLTAIISLVCLVSCDKEEKLSGAEEAAKKLILVQDKLEVTADFEVTSIIKGENDVTYSVTWASSDTVVSFGEVKENKFITATVGYDPKHKADSDVKLTASITNPNDDKDKTTKEFNIKVPKFVAATCAQYDAAKSGELITMMGVIVARETYSTSYKNTNLYIACEDGGFEAYRLACTQDEYNNDLKVGNTVYVSGTIATYNGLRELSPCTYILNNDVANAPKAEVDITSKVFAGTAIGKELQCNPVVLKNVKVISKDGSNLVVGNPDDATKKISVRVNTAVIANKTDSNAIVGLAVGDVCTISGFVGWYNGAQITPLSIKDVTKAEVSLAAGTFTETLSFSGAAADKMNNAATNYATTLNLTQKFFEVKAAKNDTGYSAVIGLNTGGGGYLRIGNPSEADKTGAQLIIKVLGNDEFNAVIDKIEITYPNGDSYHSDGFTVNGTAGTSATAEYTINADTVTITATDTQNNTDIKSIKITYTVTAK